MISIQTNVDSMLAQSNLSVDNQFQSKTIQQLTSGYKINSSGDNAAGLAIANGYRNQVAELTQGVSNANDGVSQLQIIDGGMNNISTILDRLNTLATQSASGTFTGNRGVLNSEFQTLVSEVDRQAQAIGLNTGGQFNKLMSVFIGGCNGASSSAIVSNGSVSLDLSKAQVDSQSLGLKGVQAVNLASSVSSDYDLSAASATSVSAILGTAANTTTEATSGYTKMTFTGAGFGDANGIAISVNLSGVSDTNTLVTAINAAIQSAGNGTTAAAQAFKAANISASIHTDSLGQQQLSFSSSNGAFQVTANDKVSSALMGFLASPGAPTGTAASNATSLIANGSYELVNSSGAEAGIAYTNLAATKTQQVTISANDASGHAHALTVGLTGATGGSSITDILGQINTALQKSDDSTLQQITAVEDASGNVNFVSTLSSFQVSAGLSSDGATGFGASGAGFSVSQAAQVGSGGTLDISTQAGAQAAVTALTAAVQTLGNAQAAVGRGQNQLNYAQGLAQSQITNFSAAESRIRDTDVASAAANLTKSQVLSQTAIAAMAQANSESQSVLKLLQ